jgi:hypothetical protein
LLLVPSRCARYEAIPTGLKRSQQVRSEPACAPVMECTEPGVVSVQAVLWSPEIAIVVVRKDIFLTQEEGKPTPFTRRKAGVSSHAMASEGRHHRGLREQGMYAQGYLGNLGEPTASLPHRAGVRATGLSKGPGADGVFPTVSKPQEGIQRTGKQQGAGKQAKAERPGMNREAVVAEHSTDGPQERVGNVGNRDPRNPLKGRRSRT